MQSKTHIYSNLSPAKSNKYRVDALRPQFAQLGIVNPTNIFIKTYPEYDTAAEGMAVRTVWNGNSGREDIVTKLELLLEKLKQKA